MFSRNACEHPMYEVFTISLQFPFKLAIVSWYELPQIRFILIITLELLNSTTRYQDSVLTLVNPCNQEIDYER